MRNFHLNGGGGGGRHWIFILFVCAVLRLVTQLCPTLCKPMDCSPPGSSVHGNSPGKNTGVGFHALLQGIFPTQGSNSSLSHCRWILCHLNHQGCSRILKWGAYPFSRGTSWPRNRTRVSCIAGGFFTKCVIREALIFVYFSTKMAVKGFSLKAKTHKRLTEWKCDSECDCILNIYLYLYNHTVEVRSRWKGNRSRISKTPSTEQGKTISEQSALRIPERLRNWRIQGSVETGVQVGSENRNTDWKWDKEKILKTSAK